VHHYFPICRAVAALNRVVWEAEGALWGAAAFKEARPEGGRCESIYKREALFGAGR